MVNKLHNDTTTPKLTAEQARWVAFKMATCQLNNTAFNTEDRLELEDALLEALGVSERKYREQLDAHWES